jgi:hypothetical protein
MASSQKKGHRSQYFKQDGLLAKPAIHEPKIEFLVEDK